MVVADLDLPRLARGVEGLYLERKSLLDGEPGKKKPRDRKSVRNDIAEVVAAFANADGGVLILGVEDDGSVTGHKYPADAVNDMLLVPERVLVPPLRTGERAVVEGHEVLVFEVEATAEPVMVQGNGYPYRVGDQVVRMEATKIAAWKQRGLIESWEARPSERAMADLDESLITQAAKGSGLRALAPESYLLQRKLADPRSGRLVLRRAAELLFTLEPHRIEHPNAGVRLFRVIGTERQLGHRHNVEEFPRFEGNLATVLGECFAKVQQLLRRPKQLRGLRFEEVPEYPTFAWQEAIINAVAHRDYDKTGSSVEVWMFEDRLEVRSPGGLAPDVTIESLVQRARIHVSRNPRIVRGLVDLGWMREQGEGIPRMFAEMELQFLAPPELSLTATGFAVTLRNAPLIRAEDAEWLGALEAEGLSEMQARAMALARIHGRVTNADLRQATGLDVFAASVELRALRDRDLLASRGASAATYYVVGPKALALGGKGRTSGAERPAGSPPDRGELGPDRGEFGPDRGELGSDRGELERQEPPTLTPGIAARAATLREQLGKRPRRQKVETAILILAARRWWRPHELAQALGFADTGKFVERYLSPLYERAELVRRYPEKPNHPDQAYRGRQLDLDAEGGA